MGAALYLVLAPAGAAVARSSRPVPRDRGWAARLQPRDRVERNARLGVVSLPGRAGRLEHDAPPRSVDAGLAGPGDVSVSVDLGAAGCHPVSSAAATGAASVMIDRLWLALAVAPLGVFTLVACFRPVLPHWGLIGLVSLFPLLGRKWSERLETRPRQTRRMLVACAGFSVAFLAFTIVEYRYGILQRDRDGRGGLIDASRDPTLDLYGWDQVARRDPLAWPGRKSRHVPLHPLLVSERPARPRPGWKASRALL